MAETSAPRHVLRVTEGQGWNHYTRESLVFKVSKEEFSLSFSVDFKFLSSRNSNRIGGTFSNYSFNQLILNIISFGFYIEIRENLPILSLPIIG